MTATLPPATAPPSAGQLRKRLRQARRLHAPPIGEALSDLYMLVLLALVYGGLSINAAREQLRLPESGHVGEGERFWLGVAAVSAIVGAAWAGLRAAGPMLASSAAQYWAVGAPMDRRAWLTPAYTLLVAGCGAAAAGAAVLARVIVGSLDTAQTLWTVVLGGGIGALGGAGAVLAQARRSRRRPGMASPVIVGSGLAIAVVVVVVDFSGGTLVRPPPPALPVPVLAGAVVVAAAFVAARGWQVLGGIDRASLTSGSQVVSAVATAAVWLDPSLLTGLVENRRWRRVGRVNSYRTVAGPRWLVLLQTELHRVRRHPGALTGWLALAIVQYAIAVGLPAVAGAAQVAGAYLVANRFGSGLRILNRSPGLRRALGGGNPLQDVVHLVLPAVAGVTWWLATAAGGESRPGWLQAVLVNGVMVAVYRTATRPPMRYDGFVLYTPFGLIPVELVRAVLRGPDVIISMILVQSYFRVG